MKQATKINTYLQGSLKKMGHGMILLDELNNSADI